MWTCLRWPLSDPIGQSVHDVSHGSEMSAPQSQTGLSLIFFLEKVSPHLPWSVSASDSRRTRSSSVGQILVG